MSHSILLIHGGFGHRPPLKRSCFFWFLLDLPRPICVNMCVLWKNTHKLVFFGLHLAIMSVVPFYDSLSFLSHANISSLQTFPLQYALKHRIWSGCAEGRRHYRQPWRHYRCCRTELAVLQHSSTASAGSMPRCRHCRQHRRYCRCCGLQHAGYPSFGRSARGGTTAGSGGSAARAVLGSSLLGLAWGEIF